MDELVNDLMTRITVLEAEKESMGKLESDKDERI